MAALAGNYARTRSNVVGDGQLSQGTHFAVEGTIGQPDTSYLGSDRLTLAGGLWPEAAATNDTIFPNRFGD
jgi:hypothetical protein